MTDTKPIPSKKVSEDDIRNFSSDFCGVTANSDFTVRNSLTGLERLSNGSDLTHKLMDFAKNSFPSSKPSLSSYELIENIYSITFKTVKHSDDTEGKSVVTKFMEVVGPVVDINDKAKIVRGVENTIHNLSREKQDFDMNRRFLKDFNQVLSTYVNAGKSEEAARIATTVMPSFAATIDSPVLILDLVKLYTSDIKSRLRKEN